MNGEKCLNCQKEMEEIYLDYYRCDYCDKYFRYDQFECKIFEVKQVKGEGKIL